MVEKARTRARTRIRPEWSNPGPKEPGQSRPGGNTQEIESKSSVLTWLAIVDSWESSDLWKTLSAFGIYGKSYCRGDIVCVMQLLQCAAAATAAVQWSCSGKGCPGSRLRGGNWGEFCVPWSSFCAGLEPSESTVRLMSRRVASAWLIKVDRW